MEDFASISGIEFLHIDQSSTVSEVRKELRNNEVFYHANKGFSFAG
jgi:L-arabinose isomerase